MLPLAITFYSVVLFVHIAAVVVAFGVVFTYPIVAALIRRHPQHAPFAHRLQADIGKKVISPGLLVILLAGAYLASKAHAWGEFWVIFPLLSLLVLGALGGAYFGPREEKASELAERDLAAGGGPSGEYVAHTKQLFAVQMASASLVLLVIFVMVTKPFA
jgi:uncharacterized membrane protein